MFQRAALFLVVFSTFAFGKDHYLDEIQPIFNSRCVACHGCYEAPCQLNLQSYAGVVRGFNPLPLYSAKRTDYVSATELAKGFHPVVANKDRFKDGLLYKFVAQASKNNKDGFAATDVAALQAEAEKTSKHTCVANEVPANNEWKMVSFDTFITKNPAA